jgi:hypothetical protein
MRGGVRGAAALVVVSAVATLAACGGGGDDEVGTKAEWEEKNGSLVSAYSRDLSDAINNINQGAPGTVGSCTQVQDDGKEVQEQAFPVPNEAVNGALRRAVDSGLKAAADCLRGARTTDARAIEQAQRDFADARRAMDETEEAIKAWR